MLFRSKEGRKGTGKLSTPDSHVDGESGAKTIVYNTKKERRKKEGGGNTTVEKEEFITLSPNTRARPKILFAFVRV